MSPDPAYLSRATGTLDAAERVREVVQRAERRECGEPSGVGDGKVCRRLCAPGRDIHAGGHWFADPTLDGDEVRESTARWIVGL